MIPLSGRFWLGSAHVHGHRHATDSRSIKKATARRPSPTQIDEETDRDPYFRCLLTSLVIANMLTCDLPPNTTFSLASALIIRLFFASWSPFFLM